MTDSLEVCAKATVEIFHHFPIYEFWEFWRVRDSGKVRGCLCLSAPMLGWPCGLGGPALVYAGLQSECLTEGRKGPHAGFARKYMFLFSEQLESWAIAIKTNK